MAWLRTDTKAAPDPDHAGKLCESFPVLVDTRVLMYAVGLPKQFGPGCVLYLSNGQHPAVEMTVDEVQAFIELEEKGF